MILTLWNETLGEVKTKLKRGTHQIMEGQTEYSRHDPTGGLLLAPGQRMTQSSRVWQE